MNQSRNKDNKGTPGSSHDPKLGLEAAAHWVVFESLVSVGWRDTTRLVEILFAKEPPFGGVVTCAFRVDLGCLGPKQGFVSQFRTRLEYETEFRAIMLSHTPMIRVEFPLAVKIIRESIRYARGLGFDTPEGVRRTLNALGPLDVANKCDEDIPVGGKDGCPFYVAGPDDDVNHVVSALARSCGSGNFQYSVPEFPFPTGFFE